MSLPAELAPAFYTCIFVLAKESLTCKSSVITKTKVFKTCICCFVSGNGGKGLYVALAILELSMFIMLVSNSQ